MTMAEPVKATRDSLTAKQHFVFDRLLRVVDAVCPGLPPEEFLVRLQAFQGRGGPTFKAEVTEIAVLLRALHRAYPHQGVYLSSDFTYELAKDEYSESLRCWTGSDFDGLLRTALEWPDDIAGTDDTGLNAALIIAENLNMRFDSLCDRARMRRVRRDWFHENGTSWDQGTGNPAHG